jgi:hypothetical protein
MREVNGFFLHSRDACAAVYIRLTDIEQIAVRMTAHVLLHLAYDREYLSGLFVLPC